MAESAGQDLPTADHPLSTFIARLSSYVAKALRYWEPRRLVYNLGLGLVVLGHFVIGLPASWNLLTINMFLGLFFLAVLANICYSAVYAVDLFVQFSGLDREWAKGRLALLIVGTAFGAVIAHFFSTAIFTAS